MNWFQRWGDCDRAVGSYKLIPLICQHFACVIQTEVSGTRVKIFASGGISDFEKTLSRNSQIGWSTCRAEDSLGELLRNAGNAGSEPICMLLLPTAPLPPPPFAAPLEDCSNVSLKLS
jgi:hypothetical protein